MRGGQLNRKITLLRIREGAADDYNETADAWAPLGKPISAGVEAVADGERTRAAETSAVADYRFTVRRSALTASLTARDGIRYEGAVFNIIGCKPVDGRFGIEISARARKDLRG